MKSPLLGFVSVSLLAALGCGGGDDACSAATDCGGDVIGDWKIVDSCLETPDGLSSGMEQCPQATASSGLSVSGNVSFRADGTYSSKMLIQGSMSVTMPAECLTYNGIALTCSQLNQAMAQIGAGDPDYPFEAASCSSAGSGCSCTMVMKPQTEVEDGTYTAAGDVLSMTSDFSTERSNYCVQDGQLALSAIPDPGETGKMVLLLSKQ